jgi:hypothetical protein
MGRFVGCIAAALVVSFTLTGCGSGGGTPGTKHASATPGTKRASATPTKHASVTPLPGPWRAKDVCPVVDRELTDMGLQWAVSPDNTGRACILVGQSEDAQGLVNLRGSSGSCPKKTPPAGITARQVTDLGSQACAVSGKVPNSQGGGAFTDIGIGFSDGRAVQVSCQGANTKSVEGICRSVGMAVITALREH